MAIEDVARRVCADYFATDGRITRLPGRNNPVFRAESRSGTRVFKFAREKDMVRLRFEVAVISALRAETLPVPVVEQDVTAADDRWCFFSMHDAGTTNLYEQSRSDAPQVTKGFESMGRNFAKLHALAPAPVFAGLMSARSDTDYRDEMARLRAWAEQSGFVSPETLADLLRRAAALPALDDTSVCHNDFHAVQCVVDGERVTLIDWSEASLGSATADFAIALANLAFYATDRNFRAFIDGYRTASTTRNVPFNEDALAVIGAHQMIALARRWTAAGKSETVEAARRLVERRLGNRAAG